MTWRVVIECRYSEIYFDFTTAVAASDFATKAVEHSIGDDNREDIRVRICIVREEKEDEA